MTSVFNPDDFIPYAMRIWMHGESKNVANLCFDPDRDESVVDHYGVTHYDVHWHEKGKQVLVNLYKSECFGACLADPDKIGSVICNA